MCLLWSESKEFIAPGVRFQFRALPASLPLLRLALVSRGIPNHLADLVICRPAISLVDNNGWQGSADYCIDEIFMDRMARHVLLLSTKDLFEVYFVWLIESVTP